MDIQTILSTKKTHFLGLSILIAIFVSGCASVSYYSQAVTGHLKLLSAREDISSLLASSDTGQELKQKLTQARKIREFASDTVGLPDNDSYKSFVKTGKDYITWNVIVASEFSVQAKTWCFPVAGCVSYKGYFAEDSARQLAKKLADEGFDTTVTGATAYSTIGWFDDPILDTMLRGRETRLAGLIFHELAHQQLYIKGDSDFNEAFASFVEQQGVRIWLSDRNDLPGLTSYQRTVDIRADFSDLLLSTRLRLQQIYDSDISDTQKRQEKRLQFEQLRSDYEEFKSRWDDYSGYDGWFSRKLNNARLVASATYRRLVPAFVALYDSSNKDIQLFYREAKKLAKKSKQEREDYLASLLSSVQLLDREPDITTKARRTRSFL